MSNTDEVKPCPFCGQTPKHIVEHLYKHPVNDLCILSGLNVGRDSWNTRPAPVSIDVEVVIKELRDAKFDSVESPSADVAGLKRSWNSALNTAISILRTHAQTSRKYQLCPKCNGQGHVLIPPTVPGDQQTYSLSEIKTHTCNLCNGQMVIPSPPSIEGENHGS